MNKLLSYLPPYLQVYRELIYITETEYPEIERVNNAINMILNNNFIDSLDEYGCGRWEKMLAISVNDDDDLTIRRMRILSKLLSDIPYTEISLRHLLTELVGEENYTLTVTPNDYYIMVYLEVERLDKQEVIKTTVKNMIPANLVFELLIHFREHEWIKERFTHGKMQVYTHKGLRTIVI